MKTLVEFPRIREAPEHVLERLRCIDSTAELLWWGPRFVELQQPSGLLIATVMPVWLLGTVRQNAVRRTVARGMLRTQERAGAAGNRDTWRYAKLVYQGFASVAFYPARDPTEAIAEDFATRDWLFKNRFDEEGKHAIDEAEGIPRFELRIKKILDKVHAEGPSDWRFSFAKRRHVSMN